MGGPSALEIEDEKMAGLALYDNQPVDRPLWDQAWQVWHEDGRFRIIVRYATDLFVRKTIVMMHGDYQKVLESIISDPRQSLQEMQRAVDLALLSAV